MSTALCIWCAGSLLASLGAARAEREDDVLQALREALKLPPTSHAAWLGETPPEARPLALFVLALEDGTGGGDAARRFEQSLLRARDQLDATARLALAPRSAPESAAALASQYLDIGRAARRAEEAGYVFEREVTLTSCGQRRSAWIYTRSTPPEPLDPGAWDALRSDLGSQRIALLAASPSRTAALLALHHRGVERGLCEIVIDERFAPDEAPSAPKEMREMLTLRLRGGVPIDPGKALVLELDAVLVADALSLVLDPRALLDTLHAALRPGGDLWILERCGAGRLTPIERSARRRVDPLEVFQLVVDAGFAVRVHRAEGGVLRLHAKKSGRPPAARAVRERDALLSRWRERGFPSAGRAHLVGRHELLDAGVFHSLGFERVTHDALAGPAEPVDLLVVASWSTHPDPQLFLDRPAAHLDTGGWLAVIHDTEVQAPERYSDPDRISALQPELRFAGELPGAICGLPDAAVWLFKRP